MKQIEQKINELFQDKNKPETGVDTWFDMGHTSNLNEVRKKKKIKGHFGRNRWRERERRRKEKREAPPSLYDLWSLGGRLASGQDLKSEYSSRATRGHQNKEFSSEIRAESSGGRAFRALKSSKNFVLAPRGREPS